MLTIELAELNGSGVTSQATLTDNGDDTTTVLVQATHGTMATPAA
jgi:hypothetical protein